MWGETPAPAVVVVLIQVLHVEAQKLRLELDALPVLLSHSQVDQLQVALPSEGSCQLEAVRSASVAHCSATGIVVRS